MKGLGCLCERVCSVLPSISSSLLCHQLEKKPPKYLQFRAAPLFPFLLPLPARCPQHCPHLRVTPGAHKGLISAWAG